MSRIDYTADDPTAIHQDGSAPFTGDQSMGGHNLTNVADPVSDQDAQTKKYTADHFLALAGGTMTGDLDLGSKDLKSVGKINKVTVTQPASSATLTIANGKTLTASNDATVSGTNSGDQTIALSGDVSGSGTGAITAVLGNTKVFPLHQATGTLGRIVKSDKSGSNLTLTAAEVLGSFINNVADATSRTFTLPTVADFYAGLGSPTLGGDVCTGLLFVRGPSSGTLTMATNTGWTTSGTLTIAATKVRCFIWRLTSSTTAEYISLLVADA